MFILPIAAIITKGSQTQIAHPWVWVVLVLEKAVPEQLKLHDGVILAENDMFCIIYAYDIAFVI